MDKYVHCSDDCISKSSGFATGLIYCRSYKKHYHYNYVFKANILNMLFTKNITPKIQ